MSLQPRRLTPAPKSSSLRAKNYSLFSVLPGAMESLSAAALEQDICRFIAEMQGCKCLPSDDLKKLGLDSIAFLELVIFVEKRCRIPLPLELMAAAPLTTVSALVARIAEAGLPEEGPPSP